MAPLATRLRQAGFAPLSWGYPSLRQDIPAHALRLRQFLDALLADDLCERLHVVAHSMGALVLRQALLEAPLARLQRIVLLCPPNRGSHVASQLSGSWGRICRTLTQLSDRPDGFAARLPQTLCQHYEVGIITAALDFVVRRESASLPGAVHELVVPGWHSSVLFRPDAARAVCSFLSHGRFAHPSSSKAGSRAEASSCQSRRD